MEQIGSLTMTLAILIRVGDEYYCGDLSPDIVSSIYWLKKAADQGEPNAMRKLGHILKNDFKNQQDLAKEYLDKAEKAKNR